MSLVDNARNRDISIEVENAWIEHRELEGVSTEEARDEFLNWFDGATGESYDLGYEEGYGSWNEYQSGV